MDDRTDAPTEVPPAPTPTSNGPPPSAPALFDLAHKMKIRAVIGALAALVIIGMAVAFGLVAIHLINNSDTSTAGSRAVVQSSKRSDCKTQYSSVLGRPVTKRSTLAGEVQEANADLSSQLGADLLNLEAGHPITQAQIDQYSATKANLDTLRAEFTAQLALVAALPTPDQADTHGFTFEGRHYPACPKVMTSQPHHQASK